MAAIADMISEVLMDIRMWRRWRRCGSECGIDGAVFRCRIETRHFDFCSEAIFAAWVISYPISLQGFCDTQ